MLNDRGRRTKTIWSLEAKCLNDDLARAAANEDFDAVRLVFDVGMSAQIVNFMRKLRSYMGPDRVVSFILDVPIKTRAITASSLETLELKYAEHIELVPPKNKGGKGIPIEADNWDQLFKVGAPIYFGHGNAVVNATEVSSQSVRGEVIQGGTVFASMDVHVPSTRQDAKAASFDLTELKPILKEGIDYFVLPGFSDPTEIQKMRASVESACQTKPWFILKVSTASVYTALPELLTHVDGILIARLDLALTMEPAIIPVVTKDMIELSVAHAKIVLTASEMLGSMRTNPTPTRAEVSDIANAVSDGSDAVVLTEDVAYGPHGLKAVALMSKIIQDIEQKKEFAPNWDRTAPEIQEEMDAVAFGAYRTAQRVGAKAIVCLTKEGNTALKLASFRTDRPIIAVTFSKEILSRLALVRGVNAIILEADPVIDQVLPMVSDLLKKSSWLKSGDRIVFVSVTLSSLSRTESNLFTVQTLD